MLVNALRVMSLWETAAVFHLPVNISAHHTIPLKRRDGITLLAFTRLPESTNWTNLPTAGAWRSG